MIGDARVDSLIAAASTEGNEPPRMNWAGVRDVLTTAAVEPGEVIAATWCSFGEKNIEALIDGTQLTLLHSGGILSTTGARKTLGKALKYDEVRFSGVKAFGDAEYTDDRGLGKFCIEFAGPGNVLLGRLQWAWRAKRFRDSRAQIMAVAAERDRVLEQVSTLIG